MRRRLLVIPILLLAVMAWRRRWTSDDGFIDLRVVHQIEAGNGPVFNAGERVEAATSPLWVGLLAVADKLTPFRLEDEACALALLLTLAGLIAATYGTALTTRGEGSLIPLGALVYASLPPAWDFATSGLENGLAVAWLGGVWLALARRGNDNPVRPVWLPLLLGLGPLVRPDCAIESAVFLLVLVAPGARRAPWRALAACALAAALPVALTIVRMGYYASLVPNTALAKEAALANWPQGWRYLSDFIVPYLLPLPLFLLAVLALPAKASRSWTSAALVAASLHALFVVRVGGDFMHARMLLIPLFCALLPAAAVRVSGKRVIAAAAVVLWAVVCAAALRVSYPGKIGGEGIADERGYYVNTTHRANPVEADDYLGCVLGRHGARFAGLAKEGRRVLLLNPFDRPDETAPLRADAGATVYAAVPVIGVIGYLSGPEVHIVDMLGLADPMAGRIALTARGRPGHEKRIGEIWTYARYAPPEESYPDEAVMGQLRLARRALACPPLRELENAVGAPLTPARFLANVRAAPRLTALRIPNEPAAAVASLCSSR
ncbi:MAG TPA: hypothetical protein VFV19_08040 [Candidatus Polarisedimenticolaceae bacterium]|nr:hypothetical protein [Candidatus Polarisedimenticolaceae bacterium]